MSTYVMEIIACSLIMIIFYFILKVKRYDFVDSIKLNKITLRSALPFILLGLSVYFIFIILLNCIPFFQRSKEDAHDYRYFRDPDLVTIHVPKDVVEEIKAAMPELPADKCRRYIDELAIPEKDAQLLTKYRKISEYFDKACEGVKSPKTVSNFIIGQIFRRTETEADKEIFDVAVTPEQLNELVKLLDSGKIRNNLAKATLEKMLDSGKGALEFISESDMGGLDENALNDLCKQAVESNPKAVEDYKNGKEKAIKSLVGNVMKNSRGKADPALAESKIKEFIG